MTEAEAIALLSPQNAEQIKWFLYTLTDLSVWTEADLKQCYQVWLYNNGYADSYDLPD